MEKEIKLIKREDVDESISRKKLVKELKYSNSLVVFVEDYHYNLYIADYIEEDVVNIISLSQYLYNLFPLSIADKLIAVRESVFRGILAELGCEKEDVNFILNARKLYSKDEITKCTMIKTLIKSALDSPPKGAIRMNALLSLENYISLLKESIVIKNPQLPPPAVAARNPIKTILPNIRHLLRCREENKDRISSVIKEQWQQLENFCKPSIRAAIMYVALQRLDMIQNNLSAFSRAFDLDLKLSVSRSAVSKAIKESYYKEDEVENLKSIILKVVV